MPHDGRACIAIAENRWWFAEGPHAPLAFFLEVLILIGFKSLKTELLILRELRARFAEVFIMRRLVRRAVSGAAVWIEKDRGGMRREPWHDR